MADNRMTDKDFKIGDICIYHYADGNGSLNIVEIVGILSNTISKIRVLQVIIDNSGNGWFEYIQTTKGEMNASNEYLHKIDLINRLQAENERLQNAYKQCAWERDAFVGDFEELVAKEISILKMDINKIKADATKEFANDIINNILPKIMYGHNEKALEISLAISKRVEELVGDT